MTEIVEITVAVATLARPEALARCLDALLSGSALPAEIVVIDQDPEQTARPVVAQRERQDIALQYAPQLRRGLAASRNAALERARCPIVVVTDDDCIPDHEWVRAIRDGFASPDAPDAVTGRVLPWGPEEPGLYAVSSRTSEVRRLYSGHVAPWLVGTGANLAIRRECLARVGRYHEQLGVGTAGQAGEDIDLLHRLLDQGARILYEPRAIIYHERKGRAQRLHSRRSYGYGLGACCGLWLRRGDWGALHILGQWLGLRAHLLLRAARCRNAEAVREELLVLAGTATGIPYGLGLAERNRTSIPHSANLI